MRWATFGLLVLSACSSDAYVLHRAGNPPSVYIAKFDALDKHLNLVSCEEFVGFVERMSPETGPVKCSPAP